MSTLGVLFDLTLLMAGPKRLSLWRGGGFTLPRVISGNCQPMLTGQTAFDSPRCQLLFEPLKIQKISNWRSGGGGDGGRWGAKRTIFFNSLVKYSTPCL